MTKIYCSECGRPMGEADLEEGEVITATCSGCETQLAQIEAEEREVREYARLLERDPKEAARRCEFLRGMNVLVFGDRDNGPKPKEEGE